MLISKLFQLNSIEAIFRKKTSLIQINFFMEINYDLYTIDILNVAMLSDDTKHQ